MKYAIVEISGRQFWIETGKYYDFNRIPIELGKKIIFNRNDFSKLIIMPKFYNMGDTGLLNLLYKLPIVITNLNTDNNASLKDTTSDIALFLEKILNIELVKAKIYIFMPNYEYLCHACNYVFEEFFKIDDLIGLVFVSLTSI